MHRSSSRRTHRRSRRSRSRSRSPEVDKVHKADKPVDSGDRALIDRRRKRVEAWKKQRRIAQKKENAEATIRERDEGGLGIAAPDDELEAYMTGIREEAALALVKDEERNGGDAEMANAVDHQRQVEVMETEEVYSNEDLKAMAEEEEMSWMANGKSAAALKRFKKKEIKQVDRSKIVYAQFRKDLYIESREITQMTEDEVEDYRRDHLEGVRVKGLGCPRPIKRWTQAGLDAKTLYLLEKHGYASPFPIQAQALPVIMSGRDCIACAKTGSGKTLAFLLPMFRHILDQPALQVGDGPIGLILAPTRELAIQIFNEAKKLAKHLNLRVVCCYGGTGVAEQIAQLKRGAEIVVATPGRWIDMLSANQGRVTNLNRVSFVVLDEADRMFDMGFEPQLNACLSNTRPDRQTVMFSATFPRQIEGLAKKNLKNPVQIIIGGRSNATNTVTQLVEVLKNDMKFRRLLQLLGEWNSKGNILVFVDKQEAVDNLYQQLAGAGYLCLTLHGGMEQSDRDYSILDFKKQVRTIMIATSVAARGLDVKSLKVVINYTCPNHAEDYVHRIGRTGRAGTEGTAYTFITPAEERYALEIVKVLEKSKQTIPNELHAMVTEFEDKVNRGEVKYYGSTSGYTGAKGFKFDEEEAKKKFKEQQRQRQVYGDDDDRAAVEQEEQDEEDARAEQLMRADAIFERTGVDESNAMTPSSLTTAAAAATSSGAQDTPASDEKWTPMQQQVILARQAFAASLSSGDQAKIAEFTVKLRAAEAALQIQGGVLPDASEGLDKNADGATHSIELEINDYPQHARWKVTHKGSLDDIQEMNDVAITTRGSFVAEGRRAPPGERKLHLVIEGKTKVDVEQARREIMRVINEASSQARPDESYARYKVV